MKAYFACVFMIVGVIFMTYGAGMDVTNSYSATLNIGLLFNQFEFIVVGIILFVSGYVVVSFWKLESEPKNNRLYQPGIFGF
ncbi:hypothetical protein [Kluyvera ascorbata]|nr:hypothetical protein [Kluyvera ascorbata]